MKKSFIGVVLLLIFPVSLRLKQVTLYSPPGQRRWFQAFVTFLLSIACWSKNWKKTY